METETKKKRLTKEDITYLLKEGDELRKRMHKKYERMFTITDKLLKTKMGQYET